MVETLAQDLEEVQPAPAHMAHVLCEVRYSSYSQTFSSSHVSDDADQHPLGLVGRFPSHINVFQNAGMHRHLN